MGKRKILGVIVAGAGSLVAAAYWQLTTIDPAPSRSLENWRVTHANNAAGDDVNAGAALFAFGDFGALDLDTLETSAVPWPVLATALALAETDGNPDLVSSENVAAAFKRFGFLYPTAVVDHPDLQPAEDAPFGLSIGVVERLIPPLRVTTMNIGCASCHAGPAYDASGNPLPDRVVLGRPNSGLNLETFTMDAYSALQQAFSNEAKFDRALTRLFPDMGLREKLTLKLIIKPKIRARLAELKSTIDRPLPFPNGAPGSTNGVAALKYQLGIAPRETFSQSTGFVSIPDLADRNFRSALLADGAYAPKGRERFVTITRDEAAARDSSDLAAIASFFMVPTMGMTSVRAEAAIPELTEVIDYLATARPQNFPGPVDMAEAASGRIIYAGKCAACHGIYNDDPTRPALISFPNWSGDVGTDMSRSAAFTADLSAAVAATEHGQRHIDPASTNVVAAPLLSGVWSSAPYFTNGSVATLQHVLDPATRPMRFMAGGHKLDLERVGIAGAMSGDGTWDYPEGYLPYSAPALIDTTVEGYSNKGHEKEVLGLTEAERRALLEYLKLL
jgi:mono/diheme cytochrome c family protein